LVEVEKRSALVLTGRTISVRETPISEVADPSWREMIEHCFGLFQVERSWRGFAADVASYTKRKAAGVAAGDPSLGRKKPKEGSGGGRHRLA
jgi:hypothetical protein